MGREWVVMSSAFVAFVASACGDDGGPVAKFEVPSSGPIDWGVAPFPNDVFLGSGGTVELASMPSDNAMWEAARADFETRTGFCGTCPVQFPIDGEIDPTTLAAGVVMVDPTGAKLAIETEWNAEDHLIAVRPARGIVPTPGAQYIVALTNDVRAVGGASLRAADGFTSSRARTVTEPALAALAAAGVARDQVVSLAAYTIEDPTRLPKELAARVAAYVGANGAPVVTFDRIWRASDGSLDALLGRPAQDRPGTDVPAEAGQTGTTAIAHGSIGILVKGRFRSVRVITGTGNELGTLRPDTVAGEDVPFVLAIPVGADVTRLPVMFFHHGLTGNLNSGLGIADAACKAGVAFLSLEHFNHGERAMGATDAAHAIRTDPGSLGPDGIFEHTTLTVGLRMLAISGTPADQKASGRYILGSLSQMVADAHVLIAMINGSNLSALAAADAALTGLAFDRDKIYFAGASLGTLIGTATLVGDTSIKAALLNVPVSDLVAVLTENEVFRTQVELLMLDPMDIPNRTYEPDLQLSMHPLFGFHQWAVHPLEPAALVKAVVARPGLDLLWQVAGLDETAGFPAGNHLVAAAGVPALGSFPHATVRTGTAPLQGRGAVVFAQADHFMGVVNAGSSKVMPPGLPPFETRSSVLMFQNPVASVQNQITHFLRTKRMTGTAEILAP